jgi:hypothetical protein
MTFAAFELSRFLARKVALYTFTRGAVVQRYTSHAEPLTIGGHTYAAARGISHTAVRESAERPKNDLTITAPYLLDPTAAAAPDAPPTQALGDWWRPYPPGQVVQVRVASTHVGDVDAEIATEWLGRVVAPKYADVQMELRCEPSFRRDRAYGRIPIVQRGCWVPLYSQGVGMCNVVKATHAVPAVLSAVSGLSLTATAFGTAPKNLAGGSIEWVRGDGLVDARNVRTHAGNVITIDYGGEELAVALAVTAFPNCTHDVPGCDSFGNGINYPGFPNLPTNEPMARSQAW